MHCLFLLFNVNSRFKGVELIHLVAVGPYTQRLAGFTLLLLLHICSKTELNTRC